MAKVKRNKPCGNCKKSKVRCEYEESLPCKRCLKLGIAATCHFFIKLPSFNIPSIDPSTTITRFDPLQNPLGKDLNRLGVYNRSLEVPMNSTLLSKPLQKPLLTSLTSQIPGIEPSSGSHVLKPIQPQPIHMAKETSDAEWRKSMESRLSSVDAKFTDILNVLQANQRALISKNEENPKDKSSVSEVEERCEEVSDQTLTLDFGIKRPYISADDPEVVYKKFKYGPDDFRDNVISIDQARTLFKFFDENIAQQLFGFEIKKFSVDFLWESSPILICAICTIASIHYPDAAISSKQDTLQRYLRELCRNVFFASRPRTEQEAFDTIVSLVLCSFWLSDSQMFTGIALQLAKEFHLNQPEHGRARKSSIPEQDKIKLWYLLFILDGQQSMTYHREALVSSDDYTLQNSRQLLTNEELARLEEPKRGEENGVERTGEVSPTKAHLTKLTDLRLVSQVEYNIALSESFKGNAWDLLAPKSFGIPSRSNLELDKWMVSWTVLLAPMNNGTVWSSKSTLIYYNFAKMHINSSVIRQLQQDRGGDTLVLPNWKDYQTDVKNKYGADTGSRNRPNETHEDTEDESDSDFEDQFVNNTALVTQDHALVTYNIAINAAQTVLNLVLSDADISNNLKYVPVHIHMMLYYAAILIVSPPAFTKEGEADTMLYFDDVVSKLKIVRNLQKKLYTNLPTDKSFGDQLMQNLDNLFEERILKLMMELHASTLGLSRKADLINEISMLRLTSVFHVASADSLYPSRDSSPRCERLSAWPGSHHGHP